jgi:hypothetical protein
MDVCLLVKESTNGKCTHDTTFAAIWLEGGCRSPQPVPDLYWEKPCCWKLRLALMSGHTAVDERAERVGFAVHNAVAGVSRSRWEV